MNEITKSNEQSLYYSDLWERIDWMTIKSRIHYNQHLIYNAIKHQDFETLKRCQLELMNDYNAKLLAVKTVAFENKGKDTSGIDKIKSVSAEEAFQMANVLAIDGQTNYVRRVFIPKPGSLDPRPLGIPTLFDRAKQCLVKNILEPEFEAKFDSNSFGFRPGRSAIDAVCKIRAHLIFNGPCYVLDADIRKCFDRIDHAFLLTRICGWSNVKHQIDAWLKAGIFSKNEVIFPREGTPQGGVISPLLANIALDGLQKALSDYVYKYYGPNEMKRTYFCRYADDFVVLHPREDILLGCKAVIEAFLTPIGLELKTEKTRVLKTLTFDPGADGKIKVQSNHFDFLGFRFKQRYLSKHKNYAEGGKLSKIRTLVLVDPSRIRRHKASITAILKQSGSVANVIFTLNSRISGWCNYFRTSDAKDYGDLPRKMDLWLNSKIRKWIRRTTKIRGKSPKFWKQNTKDWILFYVDKNNIEHTLIKYSSFKWSILKYRAIKSDYSPFASPNLS
jgi:RNA-directed DNA polymerase